MPSTRHTASRGTTGWGRCLAAALILVPAIAGADTTRDPRIPRNQEAAGRPAATAAGPAPSRPHILYVTADDLGWADVGYHGSSIRTPTIDRLAREGARLEQFYVQPYSTQTRAAALTGRYPMRYGLQTMQIQHTSQFALPADELLLPKALQESGYRTALIGKWHLGHARRDDLPNQRGYDHFYGHLGGEIDQDKHVDAGGKPDWWRNEKRVKEDGYATMLLAREAAALIGRHDPAMPLFMHLSLAAPQAPLRGTKPYIDFYTGGEPALRNYRAMVSAVDAALDQALKALEKRGMLRNTLVLFHAATGGAVKRKLPAGDGEPAANVASNGPFRGGRGGLHEGAVRAVALAWWPGQIAAGKVDEMMHAVDLYPTVLKLAAAAPVQTRPLDGLDVWEALARGQPSPRGEVLLNVEDFRGAIRAGDWKLIVQATLPGSIELYNLRNDPSEQDNLAERESERVRALRQRLIELVGEMAPSKYLDELAGPHSARIPIYWDDNPVRP